MISITSIRTIFTPFAEAQIDRSFCATVTVYPGIRATLRVSSFTSALFYCYAFVQSKIVGQRFFTAQGKCYHKITGETKISGC